jgi:NAD(P)H dehydrogenase (quinone)
MKSMFDACCGSQSVGAMNTTTQEPDPNAYVKPGGPINAAQKVGMPMQNMLNRMEEKVPMLSPFTGVMRDAVQNASGAPELDRLNASLITGNGEEKQTFGDAILKHRLPIIAVFPATSKTALSTIRALTTYPYRNSCAKIQLIVRSPEAIPLIQAEIGSHVTDAITWSFADYKDEQSMTAAFIGVDRLLLVPPSSEDRAELTCNGLQAAKVAGVRHIVLLSATVAQHPGTLFGRQFRRMETCLEAMKPTVNNSIMRMAWFMDNFLDMAPDLISNNRFLASWGPSGISPIALADIGRAAAAVLSTPKTSEIHYNRTFHLTGPESLSGGRMAEIFTKVFKRPIQYQDLPREEMKKVYIEGMRIPEWQAQGYVEMNELFKAGAASAVSTDVALLTECEQTTLERFLNSKRWYFSGHRSPLTVLMPASGRVGTSTLTSLMKDSHHGRVRAVVRSAVHKDEISAMYPSSPKLEVVQADFEDEASMRAAFDGADSVMIIPPEKLERFSAIDHAILFANEAGASHIVLFSVSQALDQTAIGRKFNSWERVLETNSLSFTILQSTLFHDLMFYFADQVRQPEHTVHHWLGSGRFCPVDSRDVGDACAAVLREGPLVHHRKTYSLYGPQSLNFQEMIDKLSMVLGYKIEAVPDVTSDQVRLTMQGKLPSFNVEEVIQAHETIAMGRDIGMTPDLLKLIGHARTIQRFFEDYRMRFQQTQMSPQVVQSPMPVSSTTVTQQQQQMAPQQVQSGYSEQSGYTTQQQSNISRATVTTESTTTPLIQSTPSDIPLTTVDQRKTVEVTTEIKPGAIAIPQAPTQPTVQT